MNMERLACQRKKANRSKDPPIISIRGTVVYPTAVLYRSPVGGSSFAKNLASLRDLVIGWRHPLNNRLNLIRVNAPHAHKSEFTARLPGISQTGARISKISRHVVRGDLVVSNSG